MGLARMSVRALAVAVLLLAACHAPGLAQAAQKFAVVDMNRVYAESAFGEKGIKQLQTQQAQAQAQLKAMTDEYRQLEADYSQGLIAADAVSRKASEMQRFLREADDELQYGRAMLQDQLSGMVAPIIRQLAKEGGYTMIFRKDAEVLLFSSANVDLTSVVIERLDKSTGK